ncbi:cysteine and glycine-rich protein [Blastocystis sp. ATCC 50177/Nand II]|uniref:Cysteine and glycine-rich protein n=1 Tax=Blastocystis sp. subtype 1 (strain ATCC 50177 / NandII) TaxID=478820 RepID=A0A196SCW2_BLAHN|nr:cysteine and glycine-rich protein [Blastocystis sp. ATCC 50177/Nand II]
MYYPLGRVVGVSPGFVPLLYTIEENARANRVVSKQAEALQSMFNKTREKCAECGKTVYPAELLTFHGKPYHKLCFKCTDCKRSIPQGEQYERDDMPYCKACYARLPAFKLEKA